MMALPGTRCRLCRCAAYLVEQDRVGCACGHSQSEHGSQPSLPPRRCGISGMFVTTENEPTVRSRCSRCQDLYFVHSLLEDGSPPVQIPSCGSETPATASSGPNSGTMATARLQGYLHPSASPLGPGTVGSLPSPLGSSVSSSTAVQTWSRPGSPPIASVNDRRMSSAATARGVSSPFGTFPSRVAPIPTSPQTAASSNRNARTRHRVPSSIIATARLRERKYLVIIHPEPPYGEYCSTVSGDRFRTLRSTTQAKVNAFVPQMRSLNLCFAIHCVAEDETPAAPVIHHHLNLHLTQHSFEYTSTPSNTRSSSESSSTSESSPDLPWTYLTTSKGRRSSTYAAKLQSCNSDPNLVTHAALYSNASKLCQPGAPYSGYKLVYIMITGPLCGVGIRHFCLALRGWSGHHTVNVLEEHEHIDCESLECVLAEPSTEPTNPSHISFEPSFEVQANILLQAIEAAVVTCFILHVACCPILIQRPNLDGFD